MKRKVKAVACLLGFCLLLTNLSESTIMASANNSGSVSSSDEIEEVVGEYPEDVEGMEAEGEEEKAEEEGEETEGEEGEGEETEDEEEEGEDEEEKGEETAQDVEENSDNTLVIVPDAESEETAYSNNEGAYSNTTVTSEDNSATGDLSQTLSLSGLTSGVVDEDGNLYMWGNNDYGQVGDGSRENRLTPVKVLENVESISLGNSCSGAITKDGSLYMWGRNNSGEVGNGSTEAQLTPVKVLENVETISLGNSHSGAITKDGSLYMWGNNDYGQVGNGSTEAQLTPVKILENVESISLGGYHSGAITKGGSLYMWGYGPIGNGSTGVQLTPLEVLEDVESISLGDSHSGAITKDGSLYMWGYNTDGAVGNGSEKNQLTPVKILEDVEFISLGKNRSGAITEDRSLYMWGHNNDGEIGNGRSEEDQLIPVKVLEDVESISLGGSHSGAITKDGSLYMWGYNSDGRVGNGRKIYQVTPVKVLENVESISLGGSHSGAITKDGSLYMWGNNDYGQIGNGSTEAQLTPIKIFLDDMMPNATTFCFSGYIVEDDVSATCYYSDSYFLKDARSYDSMLATMSLCFELTTWSRFDKTATWTTDPDAANPKFKNARDLLIGKLGFTNFYVNDFWSAEPTKDSIGVVAARKLLPGGATLVALGVRGGGYGQEWASNFTVGQTGEHTGFAEARDEVLDSLNEYITEQNITGSIKLWIVGYSRGGAVANMAAGAIDDGRQLPNGVVIEPENLFAYTFEAPQGALMNDVRDGDYRNIHNIINPNDIVPLVAPSSWGFARYNTDRWLPTAFLDGSAFKEKKGAMLDLLSYFTKDTDTTYKVQEYQTKFRIKVDMGKILPGGDPFIYREDYQVPTQQVILESASFLFDGAVGGRNTYYYDFQPGVREIMSLVHGGSLSDLVNEGMSLDEFFERFLGELTFDRAIEIFKPAWALNLDSFETRKRKIKENLERFVKDVLGDSDLWGSITFAAALPASLADLFWRVVESSVDDCINNGAGSLQSVINLIDGVADGGAFQTHYPEITLCWLMSQDGNYGDGQALSTGRGYRIIHINCPVDVYVYDETAGELVGAIVEDEPQQVGDTLYAYLNADNEKIIIVPTGESYKLSIKANDDSTVNYAVDEFSMDAMASTRIINYYDIAIKEGDILTGIVPAFSQEEEDYSFLNGSTTEYTLLTSDGVAILPSEEFSGEDAVSAYYTFTVSTSSEYGFVTGGGTYLRGNFAEAIAYPMAGGDFLGWYENDILVSEEEAYRFAVTRDVELSAKFSEVETYELTVLAEDGGSVTNETIMVPDNVQVCLEAIADEGYQFIGWSAANGVFEDIGAAETWFTMPATDVVVIAHFSGADNETESLPITTSDIESGSTVAKGTKISLTCPVGGARIFYTLDETPPTEESTLYTAPIIINADTVIKAIAVKQGFKNSEIATFIYKIEDDDNLSFNVRFTETTSDPYYGLYYNAMSERYESVYTGAAVKPTVVVTGLKGKLTEGIDYTVKYGNNLNYNSKGKPATVTVTGKGNYAGNKVLNFYILQADLGVAKEKGLLSLPDEIKVQSGKKVSPVIEYGDYTLKAADMNLSNKTAIKADTTIDIDGKGNFTGSLKGIAVKVINPADVKELTLKVALKANTHIYTGKPQILTYSTPNTAGELTVTAGSSKTPLTAGADYTVAYKSNVDAGTATVRISGAGKYIGTITKTFKIQPDKTSEITADLSDPNAVIAYNAKGATPAITVKVEKANGRTDTLTAGKDYKVSYANNKKTGTGKYSVTFIGNYKGHSAIKNRQFDIAAASFTGASAKSADQVYTKAGKYLSAPYVSMDGIQLSSKDYTVKYYDGEREITSKDKISLDDDIQSKEITVIVTGKGNYKEEEITTTYRVVRAGDDMINLSKAKIVAKEKNSKGKDVAVGKQEYSGGEIKPEIRVLVKDGKSWTEIPFEAYTVTYINNVNKGKATILITGNGQDAVGSKSAKFTIGTKNLGWFDWLFG